MQDAYTRCSRVNARARARTSERAARYQAELRGPSLTLRRVHDYYSNFRDSERPRGLSTDADRPTEIAFGEYLLSARLSALIVVSRSLPRLPSSFLFPLFFVFRCSRFCSLIVPRKRNVRSKDVIKENPEMRHGERETSIECMSTEFMVLAATTINNPTFVSLSSASFSYPSYVIRTLSASLRFLLSAP